MSGPPRPPRSPMIAGTVPPTFREGDGPVPGSVPKPLGDQKTSLYRLWSADDQLLYVGISRSALGRLGQHAGDKHWIHEVASVTIESYETRAAAASAEIRAIRTEEPKYNVAHNSNSATKDRPWGYYADDMPDMCHDRCVPLGDDTIYHPQTWRDGVGHYVCTRGHAWTCGWGHQQSGRQQDRPLRPNPTDVFDLMARDR